jgi:hypothetical protein
MCEHSGSGTDPEIPEDVWQWCDGLTEDDLPPCHSHMGHSFSPVNDAKEGPQTRMVCIHCDASYPVREGDLDGYGDVFDYPEWCDVDTAAGHSDNGEKSKDSV